ncbi:MAG: 16S rRNA (cytidine(1402)-2'-O)-methyltransferase [Thermomicrobiales bacterium]|nr:16S rRNA (cytidine(1402)-2'-O)-methyltransferase [Thermomicrobiales bacterium]MCO5227585.1 16S rRNA (cytidine(1402)-2'-O)-methyltransferase [Thermomicrobiales bacterium]
MGTLYVVATPIGNLQDFTPRAIEVLQAVKIIAAEDTRHSRTLLVHFGITTPTISYHHHNRSQREHTILKALELGDVALITDAGTPAIADPGQEIVAAAHAAGHTVVPIPGASAAIAAVSASGLVSGPFVFLGFLERKGEVRRGALGKAHSTGWPVVLFESPQRLGATLTELHELFGSRSVVVARELTKKFEEIISGTLSSLATTFGNDAIRGEVVIVIGGAEKESDASNAEEIARSLISQGLKPARAARELAQILGIPGDEAYTLIRSIKGSDD